MLRCQLIWCVLILTLPCLIEANPWNYNLENNSPSAGNSTNYTSTIDLHKNSEKKARSIPRFSPNTPYMTEDSLPVPVHGQPSQRYRGYRPPTIPQRRHPLKSGGSAERSRSRETEKQSAPSGSLESDERRTSSVEPSSNEKLLPHRGGHSKSRERLRSSDERQHHSNYDKANGCQRSPEESVGGSGEKKSKENSLSTENRSTDSIPPSTTPSGSIYPTPPALPYQFRARSTTHGNESTIIFGNGTMKTDLSTPDAMEQHRSQLLLFNGNNSSNRNETEKSTPMLEGDEGREKASNALTFSSKPSQSATRSDTRPSKNSPPTNKSEEEELRPSQSYRKGQSSRSDEKSKNSDERKSKSEKSSSIEAAEKFRPDRFFEKNPNPTGRIEHGRLPTSARRDDASASVSHESGERVTRPQQKSKLSGPPGVPMPPQIKYGRKFMRERSGEKDSSSPKPRRRPSSTERSTENYDSGSGRYRPSNPPSSPPRHPPQSRNRNRPSEPNHSRSRSGSFESASGSREEPLQKRRPPPPPPQPPNARQKHLFREENRRPPPQVPRPPKGAFPESFPNFSQLFPQFPGFPTMNTFQQQNSKPRI